MVLSKRERTIAIVTGVFLSAIGLWFYVYTPLLDQADALQVQLDQRTAEADKAQRLITRSGKERREWSELSGQKIKTVQSEAEQQVLNAVQYWAQDSGITGSSLKPEHTEKQNDFQQITYRVTATGTMNQISRFLYRIQTADLPVRISDMSITARKEGTDDLSLQVGISTLQRLPEQNKPGTNSGSTSGGNPTPAARSGEAEG